MLTYMQEVKTVKKNHKYPKKHCACLLLLEAEGKSLLADHRSLYKNNIYTPRTLHTHSSICGHEELLKTPACSLAYCFKDFTIYKGNFYLMSFHDIGSDLETKSVYSKQGSRLHGLPSHSVCLQTDHFSISGWTVLGSFKVINFKLTNQL